MESLINLRGAIVPHIEQFFGPWMIEESAGRGLAALVSSLDLASHLASQRTPQAQAMYAAANSGAFEKNGKIAVISIEGPITKYGSSVTGTGGSIAIRSAVRKAAEA